MKDTIQENISKKKHLNINIKGRSVVTDIQHLNIFSKVTRLKSFEHLRKDITQMGEKQIILLSYILTAIFNVRSHVIYIYQILTHENRESILFSSAHKPFTDINHTGQTGKS